MVFRLYDTIAPVMVSVNEEFIKDRAWWFVPGGLPVIAVSRWLGLQIADGCEGLHGPFPRWPTACLGSKCWLEVGILGSLHMDFWTGPLCVGYGEWFPPEGAVQGAKIEVYASGVV